MIIALAVALNAVYLPHIVDVALWCYAYIILYLTADLAYNFFMHLWGLLPYADGPHHSG